jgi:hypothetical protein
MTHVTINTEIETVVRDWAATTVNTDIARIKRTDTLRSAGRELGVLKEHHQFGLPETSSSHDGNERQGLRR